MAASQRPEKDFDRIETMHRVLLTLLLVSVAGAALGAPGVL
jgi:hypothetical protein